jgi:GTP-binding protein
VNKIDRPEQRAHEVVDELFDLLVELGANDAQLDFPIVYASAKEGTAALDPAAPRRDLRPLLEAILRHAPEPEVDPEGPVQFQAVTLGYDEFVGRLVIGRVARGVLRRGAEVVCVGADGVRDSFRVTKLFGFRGLERVEVERAEAGDVTMIAGIDSIEIGDTLCDPQRPEALPRIEVDPPTIRVSFSANTSPLAGREGRFVTGRQIGERLRREALGNVSIRLEEGAGSDAFVVAARGELQIAVLIETMRREGYEFAVSRPEIILREIDGRTCEPVEDVSVEVPDRSAGSVMEALAERRGRLLTMEHRGERVLLQFVVPSRGLFGYRTEFLSDTRGEGTLYRAVRGYEPFDGQPRRRRVGALVASEAGQTSAYSLFHIQERATLFLGAGVPVYEGQIVGENRRAGDMIVNVCKAKKLTNIRAAGKDEATVLTPHRRMGIESGLEWIEEDELLEVTPKSLRLRKRILSASQRKR